MEECVFRVNKSKTKTCCLLMWPWFGSRCFWGCLLLVLTRAVLPGCREWSLLTSCQKNLLLGTAFVSPPEVRLRFSKCGRLYLAQLLFNSKIQHSLPCLTAARALTVLSVFSQLLSLPLDFHFALLCSKLPHRRLHLLFICTKFGCHL